MLVESVEPRADAGGNAERRLDRERTAVPDPLRERSASDVDDREVLASFDLACVENGNQVPVLDLRAPPAPRARTAA